MKGGRWRDLKEALQQFLDKRIEDQSKRDVITLIEFDDHAYTTCIREPLTGNVRLSSIPKWGTKFHPALDAAEEVLSYRQRHEIPVFIFMSDGASGDGKRRIPGRMEQIYNSYGPMNVHTIGFGPLARHDLLKVTALSAASLFNGRGVRAFQDMASIVGGKYHRAMTGVDLSTAFVNIAASSSATDALASKFGKVIGDMVASAIITGHL